MTTKTYLPDFHRLYEIAADADERSLKKVYARELKKIDQASQAPQFQQLREHYEQALNWLKWQSDEPQQVEGDTALLSSAPITPVSEQVRTDATTSTQSKAEFASNSNDTTQTSTAETATPEAFEHTTLAPQQIAKRALTQLCELVERADCQREQLQQLFQEAMQDQAMSHIDTRSYFEEGLLDYLNEGWLAHKHWLFELAVGEFDWSAGRGRPGYQHADYLVEMAAQEYLRLQKVPAATLKRYQRILQQAREGASPGDEIVLGQNTILRTLLITYEHLLYFYTDYERVRAWYQQSEAARQAIAEAAQQVEKPKNSALYPILLVCLLAFLCYIGWQDKTHRPSQPQAQMQNIKNASYFLGLGEDHFFGRNGNPINYDLAQSNWEQAAKRGSTDAAMYLAELYENQKYQRPDPKLALHWYQHAAELGHRRAIEVVGNYYYDGKAGKPDYAQAANWYRKGAELNIPLCKTKLAMLYASTKLGKPDYKQALPLLKSAADSAEINALRIMGVAYLNQEFGLKRDVGKGMHMLRVSAEINEYAQYNLAEVYQRGLFGQAVDLNQAVVWYAKAAKKKIADSEVRLQKLCKRNQYPACQELK